MAPHSMHRCVGTLCVVLAATVCCPKGNALLCGRTAPLMMMYTMETMTIQIFQEINRIPNLTETCATTVVAMNNQNFQ
eukprot:scaffold22642_cov105-Skeletonema_dohrnii-CCMP3373.AAC.1